MRVAVLTYGLHPGGRSRMLTELANGLAQRGHEVSVVMLNRQPVTYPLSVPVRRVPVLDHHCIPEADVVIPASFGLVSVAQRTGRPVLRFCSHFEPDKVFDYNGVLRTYLEPVPTLAVSRDLAERIRQLNGAPCFVASPGVNGEIFTPVPEERVKGGRRICYIYRPDALGYGYKANADFWQAAATVQLHEPDLEIIVVAPDGLPVATRVPYTLVPAGTDAELAAFYRRGNVYVSFTCAGSYNLGALEAMACGTPVVLADSGGGCDYAVPGVNCFMGVPGHVPMLADLILAALRRPDMADAFRAEALATARSRTWDRFVEQAEGALVAVST